MKKRYVAFLSLILSFILVGVMFIGCKKENTSVVKVKLNEVTRSIFYAPMYAAISQGFFKEEGIEIDLTTGEGADAPITNTQVTSYIQSHQ
jgi:NitT/TauT family transport system substrate-binding protein